MTGKPDHRDRERFWIGVQEDLARLKQNPAAWQDYQDEPPYYTPEEEQAILAQASRMDSYT